MTTVIKNFFQNNSKIKKLLGIFLVVLGLLVHLIPLAPGGWIIFVGLELLGVRLLLQNKIKSRLRHYKFYNKIKDVGFRKTWPLCFLSLLSIRGFVGLFEGNYSELIWLVWLSWLSFLMPIKNKIY